MWKTSKISNLQAPHQDHAGWVKGPFTMNMQLSHPAPVKTGQAWDSASNRQMVTNLWGGEVTHDLTDFPLAFYEVKKRKPVDQNYICI